MVFFHSKEMGGWMRVGRMALVALGLTVVMVIGAAATYTDTFSSCPWGSGVTGSFTTGTSSTGLAYDGDFVQLFAWDGSGKIDCDAFIAVPSGVASFTITSRDGKAFVFNSLVWDDDAGGATISGTGPEPFTINVASGGAALTRSPSGGSKLVTSVTVSSSDMWSLMDDVSVELDSPGAAIYGNGNLIANGDSTPSATDDTNMGTTPAGTPVTSVFTIESIGDTALDLTGSPYVGISGSADFTISVQPTTDPIASGGSDTFTVKCNPTAAGVRTAVVSITNNSEASPYTFTVQCTGELDIDPPGLTSFERQTPAAQDTNADTLVFRATFDEDAQYVTTDDFTASGTSAEVTDVNAVSASVYDLTFSGGDLAGYDGIVGINLAGGQNIADLWDNALPAGEPGTDETYLVDNTAPTDPTPSSPSHTVSVWDNDNTVDIVFSVAASDGTGSGVDGFEIEWDKSASWTPSEMKEQEETWPGATFTATSNGDWYFHIATVDNAGNWTSTQHLGPFQIDTTPPSVPTGLDPSNGSYSNDTSPTLSWIASTDTGGSGIRTTDAYRIVVTGPVNRDTYVSDTDYNPTLSEGTFTWKVYARDNAGNVSSYTADTTLYIDATQPGVTIDEASAQVDPTTTSPVLFTVVFDEPIDDTTFTTTDVSVAGPGTVGAVTEVAPNNDTTFEVSIAMTGDGTVVPTIPAGGIEDFAGNTNTVSTSTDNSVTYDGSKPNVTINKAGTQSDHTNAFPVTFTAVFDEPINTGTFTAGDVSLGGTYLVAQVTGVSEIAPNNGTTFSITVNVLVHLNDGTLVATIPAGRVEDPFGNTNEASTSTMNTVTMDTDPPALTSVSPNAAYDADVGVVSVSITFDEPMDTGTNSSPTISGLATDPYTVTGSAWSNGDQTWTGTFTLVDDNELATGDYNVSGFKDAAGNTMTPNSSKSIEVDTTNPTADVTVSDLLITDADAGGVFTIIVAFDEGMMNNGTADPTLTFTPDLVGGGTPTLANASGGWGGSDQFYTVTYDILDSGADANSVTIDVAEAQDVNGNTQADYAAVGEFEIDTLNPTVSSVTVSDLLIDDGDIGTSFKLTVNFSEGMITNGSADPVLIFTPVVPTTLAFSSQSWLNASTFEVVYDILDADLVQLGVDINVDGGADAAGNAQVAFGAVDQFDIDTLNPPPGTIVITPMGTTCDGSLLDRCLLLEEGENPPMVGLCELTAIYEIGEEVTGGCLLSRPNGSTLRGSFVHVYIYTVDPEARPEEVALLEHWIASYDTDYYGYCFAWDTVEQLPGYYDVHLFFPDASSTTFRIQLIEPADD
ncbi:beta strand repeat-containing protein [Candidatus Bipolaricaulota bacterium]